MAVTKKDFWNTFRIRRGYRAIPEPEARALLSPSSLAYWRKNGWLLFDVGPDVTVVNLTKDGVENLESGIVRYVQSHPEARPELQHFPKRLAKEVRQ